ncbi:YbbR-like domain-containing protein [Flavobacteriaceae bacterium]|jgi:YbbR domain-containing protein|nr:YbbR-like domain-containing protein [Flavobacteriaceae bacterium]
MIKKNKNRKFNLIQGKRLNVFVLFLFLSFLISLLVKLSNTYTQTLKFELSPTALKSNEVLLSKAPKSINVTLSGKGFELLKYYIKTPKIEVDFSQLNKDKTHYFWTERSQFENIIDYFDAKTVLKSINPDTILFSYDHQFIKKIPVEVSVNSSFAVGFDLVQPFRSEPDSVTLIGPESVLKTITSIRTKTSNFTAVNSNIDKTVELDIAKISNQLTYSHKKVMIRAEVEKFTEGTVSVPVTIVNVPEHLNINFFPKEIMVIFYTSLKTYNSIDAHQFSVECDFNALTIDNNYLKPILVTQPKTIKTAKLITTEFEYVITPKND